MAIRCDAGCSTFVSLQEELEERDDGYVADAIAVAEPAPLFIRYPIEDLRPAPSLDWLEACVSQLADRVLDGEIVYLHCFAGRGRTGLLACCLLGKLYAGQIDAEEALARVGTYYKLRADFGVSASRAHDGMSPETETQRQQVRDYFDVCLV